MDYVLWNDNIVQRNEAYIDLEDRGYQFGDGVYEVIRIYDGQLFTLQQHINRLYDSAEKIKIDLSLSKEHLESQIRQLVRDNKLELGIVYVQVTRGISARAHIFPDASTSPVVTAYTKEMPIPKEQHKNGVSAVTLDDIRWLRCDIKSINLLPNILAKQEAKEKNCYEAILHRNGIVTEGASSNIFIVKNNKLQTHPATNLILNGITRQVILHLCQENEIPYIEKPFTIKELLTADEVILSSTTSEVMPIIQIDGKPIGTGKPGERTKELQQLFQMYIMMKLA